MIRRLSKNISLVVCIAFGVAGCGGETGPRVRDIASLPPSPIEAPMSVITEDDVAERKEIRLGVLLPLSGPDAAIGKAMLNAATLALFDSHDKRITLLPHDTRGTAEGAELAMKSLLDQKPDILIGPLFSHSIKAIKPMAEEEKLNIIGFSSDHTVAGNGVFLMNFRMEEQIERVIEYASEQGYARYAALVPETAYGTRALEVFSANIIQQHRDLTAVEFYPSDSSKLVDPVKNIARYTERRRQYTHEIDFLEKLGEDDDFAQEMLEELKSVETLGDVEFDAILLPEGGAMLTTLAAWVSYYEIDPTKIKVIGTGLWDDEMLFLEPQLYGGWFAAPDHTVSNAFLSRYKKIFNQNSPRLITLAYDAVAMAATLTRHSPAPDFSVHEITNENGFTGIEGLFRFSQDGLIERGLAVYEVTSDQFKIIDAAPTNFIDRDLPDPLTIANPMDETEFVPEDHSKEASLAELPVNDGRPFPYNPIQKDAVNTPDE